MKKTIIYILMAVLFVSMLWLNACGSKEQAADPEETLDAVEDSGDGMQDGGWTVADSSTVELPEEVQSAFDKALETLTGSYNEVTPIAYLGRQVVSGTNYAVLFRVTYADEKTPAGLVVLTVYEDLEGNAELLSSEEFSVADYNTGDEAVEENVETEPLAGGWQMPEQITAAEIPEEAINAFNKAAEGFTGNDLTPMALLGTQVVAGTNYAFLCHSTLVTAEPAESIQVVIVYEDLEGNAEITGISDLDVSRYVYTALQGGSIMKGWTIDDRMMIACCNDGTRPVIFKIERIDIPENDEEREWLNKQDFRNTADDAYTG